jgi:hypothetical protein
MQFPHDINITHLRYKRTSSYIYEESKSKLVQELLVKIYFKSFGIPARYIKLQYQALQQHRCISYECVSWSVTLLKKIGVKNIGTIFGLVRKETVENCLMKSFTKYYYCDHVR